MWSIRILNGPWAGQIHNLKTGLNKIGRSPSCDIQLIAPGISKEHAVIEVRDDRVYLTDLQSSNGTFINGVRINKSIGKMGDKFAFHDLMFDIIPASLAGQLAHFNTNAVSTESVVQRDSKVTGMHSASSQSQVQMANHDFKSKAKDYIENVVLEGVYRLPEVTEFRLVLAILTFILVLGITLLSMIPMSNITKTSIEKESHRRALTIARNLASMNQQLLIQGLESNLTTTSAQNEEGVTEAVIVSEVDGTILAPAIRAGSQPDGTFFIRARREQKEFVAQLDSNTVGASVPIYAYNAELANQTVKGYAIVIYDMGSLSYDDGAALSLFIQTLLLASLLGGVWFFFVYKLVEKPFLIVNEQIDDSLAQREVKSNQWLWPAFQKSLSNINSILSRLSSGSNQSETISVDKTQQIATIVQMIGGPSLAVNAAGQIIAVNSQFEMLTGIQGLSLIDRDFSAIEDKNLQKNFKELSELSISQPQNNVYLTVQIERQNYLLFCQHYPTATGEVEFLLFAIQRENGGHS